MPTPVNLSKISTAGAMGAFYERLGSAPAVWRNHCQVIQSSTAVQPHAFAGSLPQPQELIGSRRMQGLLDFSQNITNLDYELTFLIGRNTLADDQTGTLRARLTEIADSLLYFEDELFSLKLENGNVAGNVAFDGTVFHGDTRVIGDSANIDNNLTSAAATGTIPTAAEFLDAMNTAIGAMWRYEDDSGRPGFARSAMSQLRVVIPPTYQRAAMEGLSSTLIANTDNVFGRGLAEFDVLPNLAGDTEMWVNAVGSSTARPFIKQEREPWEIRIINDPDLYAINNGLLVMCYGRFAFAYGDPRMSILHTFS